MNQTTLLCIFVEKRCYLSHFILTHLIQTAHLDQNVLKIIVYHVKKY